LKSDLQRQVAAMRDEPVDLDLVDEVHGFQVLLERLEEVAAQVTAAADGASPEDVARSMGLSVTFIEQARRLLTEIARAKAARVDVAIKIQTLVSVEELEGWTRGLLRILDQYVPAEAREAVVREIRALPMPGAG